MNKPHRSNANGLVKVIRKALQTQQPRDTVDVEGLKRMTNWIPTSRKEKDLANYGWNDCIDHITAKYDLIEKESE